MKWLTLFLPALIVAGVVTCIMRDSRSDANFKAIATGMPTQKVAEIMGPPSWDGDCKDSHLPEINKPEGCKKELGYSATLAWTGFAPKWWIIWFGADGTVIRAAKITSP